MDNLSEVKSEITKTAADCGRKSVNLVAVSKTHGQNPADA